MIKDPSLILTFTANDLESGHESVQTVTGEDLLTRSISIEHRLLDGLKPSSDKAEISIRKGAPVTEDIIRTEGDIHAVLMDGTETLFTGYVSTNFSWSVTDYGEETLSITLEDVGTRLLEKSFITEGFHLFQCEAYRAVEAIAERAGIIISPDSQKPTAAVVRSVEGDESCRDLLTELLYELGYVYAFDEYGEMYLHKVSVTTLSGIPTVDSSSLVSVGGTAVSLRKKIRQYRTARVSFQRLGEADDYLVYRDTTGQGDGHPYCYHELQGGERFDGTENYTLTGGETRTPAYIEAVNAASETEIVGSNEIVAVTDLRTVFTAASGSINAFCSLAGGKYIKVHAENTGRTPAYITRLDAYGSILYVKDENAVIASGGSLTTDDGSTLREEMEWIHDEENAKAHANLLTAYHRNAGSEYTFTSFLDLAPGSVVHLEDDVFTGLSVNVLIVSKVTTDESDVYQYGAVGVSIFNLDADVISETFVRGDTQLRGEDAVTYFLDTTADVIRSEAEVTVKPFRRAGSAKAENIVCTLRLEAATGYGTDDEAWIIISEEDASSVVFSPSPVYGAYRVTMIVSNEEVARKTLPHVYDGETGETVSITASRSIVDYYADGFPVDDSDITVTAHASGSISIYIGDEENSAATGDGEAIITIKPSDYLDEASSVTIRAVSGKAEDTVTIMRNTLQGNLEISSSTLSFAFYADNVPHDSEETAAITVKAVNYKAFPTLRLDGTVLTTPDAHEYTVDISVKELLSKESIELRAYVHTRSEALTIMKKMDRGVLTIVSDRYSFGYYADNEPHNATETAAISIAQEGYSGMPDLYVRGLKTDYADGTYSLPSSMLQNASSIIIEIRKGSDRTSIEIRKELDTASARLFLSRDRVTYYHDNVRISGDIPFSVMYSGLFYPPKVKAGTVDIAVTDGKGTIPASLLDDEAASEVEVSAYSEKVTYATDTAIIRKEVLQLSLSFTLSAAQFGYGSDGEIAPDSITVTNTTSGLSDNSKPILKLAGIPVSWSDDGTFIITPDMVEGRYLTVEIVYGNETRSAIITKTFDGKMLRISADSQFFRLSPSGKPVDGQEITLRVHTQGIEDDVVWTDNKGLQIPEGTREYILRTGGASEPEEPDKPDVPPVIERPVRNLFTNPSYVQEPPSIMYGNMALGSTDNCTLSMGEELLSLPVSQMGYEMFYAENTPEAPADAVIAIPAMSLFRLKTRIEQLRGRKLYFRFDDETIVEGASNVASLVMIGDGRSMETTVMGLLVSRKKGGLLSGIYTIPESVTEGSIMWYLYTGYLFSPDITLPSSMSMILKNPVFVDIEADRDIFESRNLTSDAEIEAYLDSLPFEDFNSIEEGETISVANIRSQGLDNPEDLTDDYLSEWAGYCLCYWPQGPRDGKEWEMREGYLEVGGLIPDTFPDFSGFRTKLKGEPVSDDEIYMAAAKEAGVSPELPESTLFSFIAENTGRNDGSEMERRFHSLSEGSKRIYIRFPTPTYGTNSKDVSFGSLKAGISLDGGETYDVTLLSGTMNSAVITLPKAPVMDDGTVSMRTLLFLDLVDYEEGAAMMCTLEEIAMVIIDDYPELASLSDEEVRVILDESPFTDESFKALSVFIPHEDGTVPLIAANDGLITGDSPSITIGNPDSEPSGNAEPGIPDSLFDGTPFIFTITADGLSDTIMIGFVRDGADGASTGTYIGAFTERPETKPDGTEIASGDFYLDVSDPSSPVPYRWKDGIWQAVTTEDPDWSYVASVTLIDVMRYATSLVSVSAYYGYFQMLAANKAFIDSLGAETITIKDGGAIESESYQETDGLEGFHIGDDGITAASGTWKGAFANGLSFIPPTEAHITADMKEKDVYLAMKRDGITEGTYFEGAQTHWIRKDDGSVFPNPPAFFAPYITPEKDPLFHFLSLGIEKKEFVRFVSSTGNTVFSVAESEIFGYILDAFPVASDRWLLVLADVEEGKDWEDNTVYSLKRKGLYILTKKNLENLMSIMTLGTADENISKYLVKQTGLPSSWSEGELSYPMPMMDFIPYTDYVTGKTWLISQETTPALYSISLSDSTDTQFKADGTASVALADGTAAVGLYFSRGIIDVNGYLRTRTIDGTDYIEAAVVLFTSETTTAYAVIRSRDMKNWTAVAVADGETLAPVLEAKNLYPMDFMEDDGTLLMTLFTFGENTYSFAFGRYDIATATLTILPHESAVLNLHKNDFPFLIGGYGTPVYRYPLIRIGKRIYGTSSGLNLFSYDTATKTCADLTGIFTTLDISTSEASSPDEFFATRNNPLLSVEVPASEAPDYRAVMMASPDLMLIALSHVPGTERIFLVFLSSGKMAIPAEYDTAEGKLTVYPYASPESQAISETMMTTPLFFGDTVLLGINGVLMFRHLSLSIPPFTAPNLKPSGIAELMVGKPTVTDTAAAEFMDTEQIVPYTAYPVNEDTFILGLAGETVMGFYTLNKAGFEQLVSSSPSDPAPYVTPFDITYPYMTILFYDHDARRTHFWSMQSHTVFDMDTGAVISTAPFTITATDGTVLSGIIWSYGMYARAPVVKRDGKFQATVMTDDSSGTSFYHAESADGTAWTATKMKETVEDIVSIHAGSVDIGDSWLCYRYTPDDSTTSMTVSLCLVHKDGSEDTVLAAESYPMADDSGMLRAIIRPALIKTGGRFYAELPSSVVSWAEGESSATAVYESDYLLIDLIQSDNGLLVQEYIENSMRFRELSLNPSTGEISELKTASGRMFDYICGRSVFSDGGKRVSTHILGDATSDDMRVELMAVADGLTYSVTVAGIDNIGEWLSEVIYSGSLTRYLHIFSLYNELYTIVNGGYDAMNETGRAIDVPDAEIEESAFIISDSAVVDIREKDDAMEIRLLPFSYEIDDTIKPFSELTMQPSSLFSGFFGKCWYIGNPEIVEPFLVIHKDSEEQVGVTFHWNFPAQLTSTSPDALLRAPILRDGAMNSSADTAIPDSFIDALPED